MPIFAALAPAAGGVLGSILSADASKDNAAANERIATMQQFRPYGITTPFGSSSYTTAEQAAANQALLARIDPRFVQRMPDGTSRIRQFQTPSNTRSWDNPDAFQGYSSTPGYAIGGSGNEGGSTSTAGTPGITTQAAYDAALAQYGVSQGQSLATSPQATVNRSQPIQQGTATALQFGQDQLGRVGGLANVNPTTLADSQFQRYLKFVQPERAAELDKTLGGLALTGNLGYLNNSTGTNPVLQSLQEANNRSDMDIFGQFQERARANQRQDVNQALQLGQQGFATAGNIDALAGNTIDQGAALGGRAGVQSNAAAQSLTNAANINAGVAQNQALQVGNLFNANNPATQRLIDWFKNPSSSPSYQGGWNSGQDLPTGQTEQTVG